MTVHKIPFNEAADIVQDRFHAKGKPYSFAVRRNPQPPRNNRTQEKQPRRLSYEEILSPTPQNTKPSKEQTQNQQEQKLTHPIAQQADPDIVHPSDHATGTERQNTSQQSQNMTETTNQSEVPKPPQQKKHSTSEKSNKPRGDEKEKKTTQEGNQVHASGTNDTKNKTISRHKESKKSESTPKSTPQMKKPQNQTKSKKTKTLINDLET